MNEQNEQHVRVGDLHLDFEGAQAVLLRSLTLGKAVRAPQFAAAVVSFCGDPRSRQDVIEQFGGPAGGLYDALVGAGILVPPAMAASTPGLFHHFARPSVHEMMLNDRVRVDCYRAAIDAAVRPGMVVMDAGTGSGLLALMAARAGAARVYAVDNASILTTAAANFAAAQYNEVIQPVEGDFADVSLPEKVDLIITETFGSMAFVEGAAADLRACSARNLKAGGAMLPSSLRFHVAPVADPGVLERSVAPFQDVAGVDLAPLREASAYKAVQLRVQPASLLHPGLDFATATVAVEEGVTGAAEFTGLTPGAAVTGFLGWFSLGFACGSTLPTGPHHPATSWAQTFLPAPVEVSAAGALSVQLRVTPAHDNRRRVEIALRVGEGFERMYRL